MEPKFAKPSPEQVEFVQSSCAAFLDIVDELGIETDSASLDTPGICDAILEELADPIKEDEEFREHVAAVLGCALGEYLCHHLHAKWFAVTDAFGQGLCVVVTPPPAFEPRTQLAIIDSMSKRVGVEPAGFVVPFIGKLMESAEEMHGGVGIKRKR